MKQYFNKTFSLPPNSLLIICCPKIHMLIFGLIFHHRSKKPIWGLSGVLWDPLGATREGRGDTLMPGRPVPPPARRGEWRERGLEGRAWGGFAKSTRFHRVYFVLWEQLLIF